MSKRYEDNRLYCTTCQEQPSHFREIVSWQVNQVTPDGTHVHMLHSEVEKYRCWVCDGEAFWGYELNA